ncbi:MAG: M1 family metallopeptidase [Lewinellaceae bacterium]|nr:M1 family metallopeptidase [Lewinellaceae bacterium]
MKYSIALLCSVILTNAIAQAPTGYWQQRVEYQIDIRLDDQAQAIQGREKLKYYNHSPDTLRRVFFHLYWNAFQPSSSYARWAKARKDPFTNERLFDLKQEEQGRQDIFSVLQNGSAVSYRVNETIMEVELSRPLLPGDYDVFDIAWQGQVPVTIKRGGRDNSAGVAYSFTQWYPKICAYDRDGWHADPYIGREFYGEFGSFKVDITLPKKYVVAATGVLQNGNTIGYGYEKEGVKPPPNYGFVNVWKFSAENVHDFAWAADPEFTHEKKELREGLTLHFFYQPGPETTPFFQALQQRCAEILPYMEARFGKHLYPQFSFVQGGESAMEYPMLTLIEQTTLAANAMPTAIHEWMHNWYYGMIGNDENEEAWLDEGFASYATADVDLHAGDDGKNIRSGLASIASRQWKEPLGTPANAYSDSYDYYDVVYGKGAAFLWQIRYIVGEEPFQRGMLRYYDSWHFKHPRGGDFLRCMERSADMELDWFYDLWVKTTKTVDYGIEQVAADGASATNITLKNFGEVPMPAEVLVQFRDGSSERHYVPLDLQYGAKQFAAETPAISHDPWSFSVQTYVLHLNRAMSDIKSVEIDPGGWTADKDRKNNRKDF